MSYQNPDDPWGQQPGYGQQGWGQQQPGWGQQPPGYQPYPDSPTSNEYDLGTRYAEWGHRLGASVLDLIIVLIPGGIIDALLVGTKSSALSGVIIEVLAILYIGLMVGSRGQTVGQIALGTAVRDQRTGGPIGMGRAFLRAFLFIIAWDFFLIPWLLNVLWPLWDARKQTISDKAASAVVVMTK